MKHIESGSAIPSQVAGILEASRVLNAELQKQEARREFLSSIQKGWILSYLHGATGKLKVERIGDNMGVAQCPIFLQIIKDVERGELPKDFDETGLIDWAIGKRIHFTAAGLDAVRRHYGYPMMAALLPEDKWQELPTLTPEKKAKSQRLTHWGAKVFKVPFRRLARDVIEAGGVVPDDFQTIGDMVQWGVSIGATLTPEGADIAFPTEPRAAGNTPTAKEATPTGDTSKATRGRPKPSAETRRRDEEIYQRHKRGGETYDEIAEHFDMSRRDVMKAFDRQRKRKSRLD